GVSMSPTASTSAAAPFFSYQAARIRDSSSMGFAAGRLNPSYSRRRSCARNANASGSNPSASRGGGRPPVRAGPQEQAMGKRFTYWIIGGLILGAVVGYILNNTLPDQKTAAIVAGYFSIITDVFLRLIKMIIAPLVISMLIVGIAHMGDTEAIGRIGLKAM